MKHTLIIFFLATWVSNIIAQAPVDLSKFNKSNGASASISGNSFSVSWPAGKKTRGRLIIDLDNSRALFQGISLSDGKSFTTIVKDVDPVFLLTVGKRDLISQNGWNIFFDKVPLKPHQSYKVEINKKTAAIASVGSRTLITIGEIKAPDFTGDIEITLYNGSPLINIAAVVSTRKDSTASFLAVSFTMGCSVCILPYTSDHAI